MINKPKTGEEWQKIVNDFSPKIQSKKDYCKERNINYNTFRNWYFKLKSSIGLIRKEGKESKLGVVSEVTKKIINKDYNGLKKMDKKIEVLVYVSSG